MQSAYGLPGRADFSSPSPDGRMIAYRKVTRQPGRNWSRAIERNYEVFFANLDSSGEHDISSDPVFGASPVWTPGSKWVAFTSGRDGVVNSGQIFAASPDGRSAVECAGRHGAERTRIIHLPPA